jgi:hypothetical protein
MSPAAHRVFLSLLVLGGLGAGLALVQAPVAERLAGLPGGGGDDEEPEAIPLRPPGFWHRARPVESAEGSAAASPEERARLVSLSYLGGRSAASDDEPRGVVRFDPERAAPGVSLYTSGHGPEAILMDLEGRPIHRWRLPFERAFPGAAPVADTEFFRRARLLPGGRLLALYQTGGLVFLDPSSRLLGRCPGNFYNDVWVGEDGRIWTVGKTVATGSGAPERLDDSLVLLRFRGPGEDCREVRRISLTSAFERSAFAGLLEPMAPAGDVFHTNAVEELDGALAGRSPLFARGNLLVSLREIDVVAIVDPEEERVVWAQRGPWDAQHDPGLLPSGRILLFDNRGGAGHSRLLELDPLTGRLAWTWEADPPAAFDSPLAGTVARLPGGNTLVTESVPGRAFELDPEGRVVWEFRSPHRAGPDDSLVAMLFEVQRLPEAALEGLRP